MAPDRDAAAHRSAEAQFSAFLRRCVPTGAPPQAPNPTEVSPADQKSEPPTPSEEAKNGKIILEQSEESRPNDSWRGRNSHWGDMNGPGTPEPGTVLVGH